MSAFFQHSLAAILVMLFAIALYFDSFSLTHAGYLLPRILTGVILLLSGAMIIEAYLYSKKKTEKSDETSINKRRALIFILLIISYIGTIKPLGYFTVTPLFIVGAYWYLKAINLKKSVMIAVGFTVFVYLLFVGFLQLPIPLGPME